MLNIGESSFEKFEKFIIGRTLYLYGAGGGCKKFIEENSEKGYEIKGIIDGNSEKWGTVYKGYKVVSLEELRSIDRDKTVVLITSYAVKQIADKLMDYGIRNIFSATIMNYRKKNSELIFTPFKAFKSEENEKIQIIRTWLSDSKSVEIFDKLVEIRNTGNASEWYKICSHDQYFSKEIFQFSEKEVFVDGGAYTGDTAIGFARFLNNKYKGIFCFEPDRLSFDALIKVNLENMVAVNKGLWNKNDTAYFEELDSGSSRISDSVNKVKVELTSIDETHIKDVTYIKMDIEGAEMEGLMGAKDTIRMYKPKLAICLYHKPEDLIDIPIYIKKLVPEYKIYIRHHSLTNTETVLYAQV